MSEFDFSDTDIALMRRALALAELGRFSTSPNPRVGCVIAHGGQIVGEGFHVRAGEPHAEVHALRQAGEMARGATAYVSLEPCAHHGRTPPCADALLTAGVARVVAAMRDPNPAVAGKGLARLRAAGLQVACGLLEDEARALNRGFLSRIERGRPFVKLKTAASLDGKTALADGRSQWITGAAARHDVQIERAQSCAVITGIGTVLADNPQLNVRAFSTLRQPVRVVLDSGLRMPADSRMLQEGGEVWLATCAAAEKVACWTGRAKILSLPSDAQGRVDLSALLVRLAQEGVGELMVEAGATVAAAFLAGGWVDEIVHYQSAKILGAAARPLFALPEQAAQLQAASEWQSVAVRMLDNDIKWTLRRVGGFV